MVTKLVQSSHRWVTSWYNSNGGPSHTNPTQQNCLATSFTRLPKPRFSQVFLESISNGFWVGYNGSNLQSAGKNLSATAHLDVVDKYLHHELSLGRMLGLYPTSACPEVHISRFGVIPKNHQPNKWRLITDLSPAGSSVNDGILPTYAACPM